MKYHFDRVGVGLLLISFLILPACTPTRFVKPLEKEESALGFNLGGPLIHFAGAVIPVPFSSVYFGHGFSDDPYPNKVGEGSEYRLWRPTIGVGHPYRWKDWEFGVEYKFLGAKEENMVIYGFSLGSIPAIQICMEERYDPMKLFLEAPIGNIDAMVQGGSSLSMPSSFFTEIEADNFARIEHVDQPLFLFHGRADYFLLYLSHGKPIYDNHQGNEKGLKLVEGGEHGDTPDVMRFSGLYEYCS